MTKLVDQRAADEAKGSGDEHPHGRRVYWRASALLVVALLLSACHGSTRRTHPGPGRSFLALDAEQQRLIGDYEPVSEAMTAYELALRDWRAGRLADTRFRARARSFRGVVASSLARLRRARSSGGTAQAKTLLVAALAARHDALDALVAGHDNRYHQEWNDSVVLARRGLTKLQDIRDQARLIPLPEDSVS